MIRRAAIVALAIIFCLTGCGQKGPLRLPEAEEPEPAKAEQQNEDEQE